MEKARITVIFTVDVENQRALDKLLNSFADDGDCVGEAYMLSDNDSTISGELL